MDTQTLFEQRPATVFLLIVDGVLGTVAGGYGVVNAVAGYPVTAAAQILTAIVAGVSLVLIVRDLRTGAATTALPRHLTFGVTVMLSVVLLASGGGTSDVSPFMFVVPPAVMLLGSRRTATVVNFLFWLVLAVSVARPGATAWVQGTDRLYHLSTLIAYTAVNVYVFMLTDLSYRAYRRVRFLATHDPVTGLHRFDTRESSAVEGPYAVLLQLRETDRIRLEGGNRFVEEVMQALAQRLARRKSEACGLYAYSDTSLLVSPALDTSDRWPAWINGTMQDLTRPVRGSERTHTPQLAVYVVPEADRLTRSELGGRLETTIQGNRGGGGVAFYDANLDRMLRARVEMHDLLRSARDRGELSLAYQPLVDAIDGDVVGAEVLMRWHSAVLGPVSPATFIPVAEETGMIGELTEWMLVRAWRETCGAPPSRFDTLSVNVSPAHLEQPDFLERLQDIVAREGIDPRAISIEITEGLLLQESRTSHGVLDALTRMGFSLSIDDFGTGYSNLSYLRQLSVDRIKIDRAFVTDLVDDDGRVNSRATPLVEAMIFMAKTLGISTLAEGVETRRQAEVLRDLGCETFQGYLFGRPEPSPQAAQDAVDAGEGNGAEDAG